MIANTVTTGRYIVVEKTLCELRRNNYCKAEIVYTYNSYVWLFGRASYTGTLTKRQAIAKYPEYFI